jgi:hypothetical protein
MTGAAPIPLQARLDREWAKKERTNELKLLVVEAGEWAKSDPHADDDDPHAAIHYVLRHLESWKSEKLGRTFQAARAAIEQFDWAAKQAAFWLATIAGCWAGLGVFVGITKPQIPPAAAVPGFAIATIVSFTTGFNKHAGYDRERSTQRRWETVANELQKRLGKLESGL